MGQFSLIELHSLLWRCPTISGPTSDGEAAFFEDGAAYAPNAAFPFVAEEIFTTAKIGGQGHMSGHRNMLLTFPFSMAGFWMR